MFRKANFGEFEQNLWNFRKLTHAKIKLLKEDKRLRLMKLIANLFSLTVIVLVLFRSINFSYTDKLLLQFITEEGVLKILEGAHPFST